jgi:mRNA interferase RelE/StbE
MSWVCEISRPALKQIKKLGHPAAKRIFDFLEERIQGTDDPRSTGKQLTGNLSPFWRYRVGDYRILCRIEDNVLTVLVIEVGHRKDIYE